jgi:hypothetical protein
MQSSKRQNAMLATFAKITTCTAALLAIVLVGVAIRRPVPQAVSQKVRQAQSAQADRLQLFKFPMRFEPNEGQSGSPVKFVARGSGYGLFLMKDEAVLELSGRSADKPASTPAGVWWIADSGLGATGKAASADVLRIKLRDANQNPRIEALDPLVSRSNYLIGNDPRNWRTGVPNYARVAYREVYPGIDLIYHGDGRQLEYDFVVALGRDVRKIRLNITGARRVTIGSDGQLHLRVGASEVVEHAPVAYQQIGNLRRPVQSTFVRVADNTIGFQIASYDRNLPLTIDPVLVYSTYLGGGVDDVADAIALDSSNNVYVVGQTGSGAWPNNNFPVTAGALQTSYVGMPTGFVSKLSSDGSALLYSTYLGGNQSTAARGIAVDSSGNAYVTGSTAATDFAVTPAALQTTVLYAGGVGFVSKLNSDGSALIYSTYLGGAGGFSESDAITLDSSNSAYVSGYTEFTEFSD